jgi:hypothetical protein
MGKLPACFCFGFAALRVFNPLDIQPQMSGGTAGFCFIALATPSGLASYVNGFIHHRSRESWLLWRFEIEFEFSPWEFAS